MPTLPSHFSSSYIFFLFISISLQIICLPPSLVHSELPCITDPDGPAELPDNGSCIDQMKWLYLGKTEVTHIFRWHKNDFPVAKWQFTLKNFKREPDVFCIVRVHKVSRLGYEEEECITPPNEELQAVLEYWDSKGKYNLTRSYFLTKRNPLELLLGENPIRTNHKKADSKFVIVKWGDTLSHIAIRYGTTVKRLMEVNRLLNDRIFADQQLKIPTSVQD